MQTIEERLVYVSRLNVRIVFAVSLIIVLIFSLASAVFHLFSFAVTARILFWISALGVAPVIWRALSSLSKKRVTVDLLASVAIIATFINGDYVSAVFINLMLASAALFDLLTEKHTESSISALLKLRPAVVRIEKNGKIMEVSVEAVNVGDIVIVEAGGRIPIDGTVTKGQASVNQSSLTGESELISKSEGSKVFSATLVEAGSLSVLAEKVGNDTTLAKMIALVDDATREKTKLEGIADRFSAYYIGGILVLSAVAFLITHNANIILGILLVTCADDIAVAIPLGFTIAIAKAARHGILIKGAATMERLRDIRCIVTDKTGTITRGITRVSNVVPLGGTSEREFLLAVSVCTARSIHPIAKALGKYLKGRNIAMIVPDEVNEQPGFGLSAKKDGRSYLEGKTTFLVSQGIKFSDEEDGRIRKSQADGESVTVFAKDGKVIGFVSFEDEIRQSAREVIRETRELGIRRWFMLTGDNEFVASRVSGIVGADSFFSNLRPEDKLNKIRELKKDFGVIAMIGDGVNDAPALALADASFAMGAIGSDAAVAAADVALMRDNLEGVSESILLSKETLRIVKQNFGIWAVTNVVGLTLVFGGFVGPVGASAYNFLTDFLPIMNVFQIWYLKINKHTYKVAEGWK